MFHTLNARLVAALKQQLGITALEQRTDRLERGFEALEARVATLEAQHNISTQLEAHFLTLFKKGSAILTRLRLDTTDLNGRLNLYETAVPQLKRLRAAQLAALKRKAQRNGESVGEEPQGGVEPPADVEVPVTPEVARG